MTNYPTPYAKLSDTQLNLCFLTESWNRSDSSTRLQLCQEVENRRAEARGTDARHVTCQAMNGAVSGQQQGNSIFLNADLLQYGMYTTSFQDENGNARVAHTAAPAPSWELQETVLHEGTHGRQADEGRAQSALTYVNHSSDYALYRIQPDEKEAFAAGQYLTLQNLQNAEKAVGHPDPNRQGYLDSVRANSFEDALREAQANYNDPNVESTLNQVIHDRENDIAQENPSRSYASINQLMDDQIQQYLNSSQENPGQNAVDDGGNASAPQNQTSGAGLDGGEAAAVFSSGVGSGQDGGEAAAGSSAGVGSGQDGANESAGFSAGASGGQDDGAENSGGTSSGGASAGRGDGMDSGR